MHPENSYVIRHVLSVLPLLAALSATACGQPNQSNRPNQPKPANHSAIVSPADDGKLQYKPDEHGNTLPDFSNCGYGGGGVRIPDVVAKVTLKPDPKSDDDTARIQGALDEVA